MLGALAAKALEKARRTLLRGDVRERLLDLVAQVSRPAANARNAFAMVGTDLLMPAAGLRS